MSNASAVIETTDTLGRDVKIELSGTARGGPLGFKVTFAQTGRSMVDVKLAPEAYKALRRALPVR